MSQHWHHTEAHDVLVGFDKPLQGYFLVIYPKGGRDGAEDPTWSNLDAKKGESHPEDFSSFDAVLKEFGIALPDELRQTLEADKEAEAAPRHPFANLFG